MTSPGTEAEQCRAVLIDFLSAIDQGRATDALHLFTEDADFDARGTMLRGHGEIARFLTVREEETERRTVHVVTNEVVRRHDEQHLELTALLMLYEHQQAGNTYQLDRILNTTQAFRRTDHGWRISSRVTHPIHRAP